MQPAMIVLALEPRRAGVSARNIGMKERGGAVPLSHALAACETFHSFASASIIPVPLQREQ